METSDMTHIRLASEILINISDHEDEAHLEIQISSGMVQQVHQFSLAQARALSLEIIRQVYRAELRNRASEKAASANARERNLGPNYNAALQADPVLIVSPQVATSAYASR